MRCVVPSQRPHMSPACCGGCRAHMGLDPDGPQAACGPLHLAGTRPPASWELSAGPRCVPATGGLPQSPQSLGPWKLQCASLPALLGAQDLKAKNDAAYPQI